MAKVDSVDTYSSIYASKTLFQVKSAVEIFVRSGDLRSVLEKHGELKDCEIDYLIGLLRIAIQGR